MDVRPPIDRLSERVIGCAITVHKELGPGLLESIYRECLLHELMSQHLGVERQRPVPIIYRGHRIRNDLKLDLLIERSLVVEVKAIERLHPIHQAQVIRYLKLSGYPAGLLMNFNAPSLRAGLKRLDHPARYAEKSVTGGTRLEEQPSTIGKRNSEGPEAVAGRRPARRGRGSALVARGRLEHSWIAPTHSERRPTARSRYPPYVPPLL